MTIKIYGEYPDRELAAALTRRRINFWKQRVTDAHLPDLREAFTLAEAVHYQSPQYVFDGSRRYGTRVLTVEVGGVVWGHIAVRRSGKLVFHYYFDGDPDSPDVAEKPTPVSETQEDETAMTISDTPLPERVFHGPEILYGWMLPVAPDGYTWHIQSCATDPVQRCMRCLHCGISLHRMQQDGEWLDAWDALQCEQAPCDADGDYTGHTPGAPVVDRPEPLLMARTAIPHQVIPRIPTVRRG